MELRRLEYFVAVVEEANFTRAAERVHVAQSGLSAQIRKLERDLGAVLLHRSGRTATPTEAGHAVLPYARAALAAYAGARDSVAELEGLVRGHLRLGMTASVSAFDLPGLLGAFHEAHPGVRITLSEHASDVTIDELRAGRLDLAFAGVSTELSSDLAVDIFADEPVVAAVAPNDVPHEGFTLATLCEQDLICLPPGSGLRGAFDAACAAAGAHPRIVFEAGDPHLLARLAARGLGIAILPHAVGAAHASQVAVVPIAGSDIRARIALLRIADTETSPAARAFARTAHAWMRTVRHE